MTETEGKMREDDMVRERPSVHEKIEERDNKMI